MISVSNATKTSNLNEYGNQITSKHSNQPSSRGYRRRETQARTYKRWTSLPDHHTYAAVSGDTLTNFPYSFVRRNSSPINKIRLIAEESATSNSAIRKEA